MFVREVRKPNGSVSIRIVESVRRGNKVVQKMVRSLGQHKDHKQIEIIRKAAEDLIVELRNARNPALPGMEEEIHSDGNANENKDNNLIEPKNLKELQRVNSGIEAVIGRVYSQMKFNDVIVNTNKDDEWNDILRSCVLARVAAPESKSKTSLNLERDFAKVVPLQKIYRMMDHLARHEDRLKSKVLDSTLSLFNQKVDVAFFDVTTLYFESFEPDDLRRPGFSKDCKFKETQVVLALVTNCDGHPVTYEIFPGNTYEGSTLIEAIRSLKSRMKINKITLVADRAMFNSKNLDLMDSEEIQYVVAAKLKALPKTKKVELLQSKNYCAQVIGNELHWVKELAHERRRLIVTYSKKRAHKDANDRKRLVDRLLKKVKNGKINIGDLINNHGTKKYLRVRGSEAEINQDKIDLDSQWDGLHGLITNIPDLAPQGILERYRQLWKIELAFRINKNDLKMRPIYHWKPNRIKAHIGICFLAYSVLCAMNKVIKEKQLTISLNQLRDELLRDQYSVLEDRRTHRRYRLPSQTNHVLSDVYKAFGLTRTQNLTAI